jgi:aconitate hydratase
MYKNLNLKQQLTVDGKVIGDIFSLPMLQQNGINLSKLPYSLRIILESMLRNLDHKKITNEHIESIIHWHPTAKRTQEIPFVVSRVILQDYTGVPLLADLAAMREAMANQNKNPKQIEPLVPVDLVIDHSVQTNNTATADSLVRNMNAEFARNQERYKFLKWGASAFSKLKIVPPGVGIVHQINIESLATGVFNNNGILYPDTVVGTDSHTTMVNCLGVVGWGVGGIEAEASMLGQPMYMLLPDVVGVHLTGKLNEGVTSTDLVLSITELLRKVKVVDKFVEYFGTGARSLSIQDRATIANMAPDYGATMGYFAVDEKTIDYYRITGRSEEQCKLIAEYYKVQQLFGIPDVNQIEYSQVIELDLSKVVSCVAGPKRPQDRINLPELKNTFSNLLTSEIKDGGYSLTKSQCTQNFDLTHNSLKYNIKHGDVIIAAITSCTNTSNPSVLLAAGLVAKKAVEYGLHVKPYIKTSLAPGSRVVTQYLQNSGLLKYLEQIGFNVVAYGCTTCIGNSGELLPEVEEIIQKNDLVLASVLSGNRNFEARVHQSVKANFLMSPPLVIAFALAGSMLIDLANDPIGISKSGEKIYLRDLWPSNDEINHLLHYALDPKVYREVYNKNFSDESLWKKIPVDGASDLFKWDKNSTYIACPPFFANFQNKLTTKSTNIVGARILALLGDSITTDHISPAGNIKLKSPAGSFLIDHNIEQADFNSYGARRGHHEVMMRGTFANTRLKNQMTDKEGGFSVYYPDKVTMSIYDVAMKYQTQNIPLVVFAGDEYGTGSSRDWAAKGTMLLGVKIVVAKSFERIHRSNLIGMGVLPCQFIGNDSITSLDLNGSEKLDFIGLDNIARGITIELRIHKSDNTTRSVSLLTRLDTDIEVEYYLNSGILPYILRQFSTND